MAVKWKIVYFKKEAKKWQITQKLWRYINCHTPQTLLRPFFYRSQQIMKHVRTPMVHAWRIKECTKPKLPLNTLSVFSRAYSTIDDLSKNTELLNA